MEHKIYYFLGLPGCGKSYALQMMLGTPNVTGVDMDAHIQYAIGDTISNFVNQNGWEKFREIEQAALTELTAKFKLQNQGIAIIACGGGTPCFYNNMDFMNANGTTVWFNIPVPTIASRLIGTDNVRPMLKDNDVSMMNDFIENLLTERAPFYSKAAIIIKEVIDNKEDLQTYIK
jgi:shikimate kinase